jgi:hypothetical protein
MQPRYPYSHRAIVIRLEDGSLFVLSPIPLTPGIRADVDRLGTVKYLVSPNHLHHLYLGDWGQAYPDAKLYASPSLPAKRKDLNFYTTLNSNLPEPEWSGQIDQCILGSGKGWFDEIAFFHRASGTLVLTDFVMDFNPETFSGISKVTTRWNQMYRHTPRGVQFAHPFDKKILREALQTIRAWEPQRVIVAHSPWLCVEGQQVTSFLDAAFDWLKPKSAVVEGGMAIAQFLTLALVILPIHSGIVLIADILYPRLFRNTAK